MSEQNIIPSAPPLYPSLPRESVGDFRLNKMCDCQKELENEISHYKQITKNTSEQNRSPMRSPES